MLLQKLVLIVTYVQNTVELFLNPEVPSVSLVYYLHLAVYLAHVIVTRTVGLLPTVGSNRISEVRSGLFLRHLLYLHSSLFHNAIQSEITLFFSTNTFVSALPFL